MDYGAYQELSYNLIVEYGAPIVITHTTQATFNPTPGPGVSEASATIATTGGYGLLSEINEFNMPGSVILSSDKLMVIPNYKLSFVPSINDVITLDSVDYTIVFLISANPGGISTTNILYKAQVRK